VQIAFKEITSNVKCQIITKKKDNDTDTVVTKQQKRIEYPVYFLITKDTNSVV
jgi:hypothetical protein